MDAHISFTAISTELDPYFSCRICTLFFGTENRYNQNIMGHTKHSAYLHCWHRLYKHMNIGTRQFYWCVLGISFTVISLKHSFQRSARTPKPGPVGGPLREVSPPAGSHDKRPFLKKEKKLISTLILDLHYTFHVKWYFFCNCYSKYLQKISAMSLWFIPHCTLWPVLNTFS